MKKATLFQGIKFKKIMINHFLRIKVGISQNLSPKTVMNTK